MHWNCDYIAGGRQLVAVVPASLSHQPFCSLTCFITPLSFIMRSSCNLWQNVEAMRRRHKGVFCICVPLKCIYIYIYVYLFPIGSLWREIDTKAGFIALPCWKLQVLWVLETPCAGSLTRFLMRLSPACLRAFGWQVQVQAEYRPLMYRFGETCHQEQLLSSLAVSVADEWQPFEGAEIAAASLEAEVAKPSTL